MAHLNEQCDICKPIGAHGTGAALHTPTHIETAWPDAIFRHFRRLAIRQVGYVPDAGHSRLIALCQADPDIADVGLTTEEEGVGLVAGAALGGQRAALLMQSSGVGNCINMFSLLRNCGFACVVFVTMRGEFGEFNPWQVPMGSTTAGVFELSGIKVLRASHADEVREVVEAAASQAYNACTPTAVLLSQRLIGAKVFVK